MEVSIQRALNDKLYDKRKVGALEYVFPPPKAILTHFISLRLILISCSSHAHLMLFTPG